MTKKQYILISTEFIKLGQFLKFTGVINNGSEAKFFLFSNDVFVNGELENRRGRKIYNGYEVLVNETLYVCKKEGENNE